jgi:hypothetical protein
MGFAGGGQSIYPIVNCDLSDVIGTPDLLDPATLARALSKPNHSWKSVGGPDNLFLATRTAGVGAFGPFEEHLEQKVGSEKVQARFHSTVCEQTTHQQMLRRHPGDRGSVSDGHLAFGECGARRPCGRPREARSGPVPRHSTTAVTRAVRDQLEVPASAEIEVELVVCQGDRFH